MKLPCRYLLSEVILPNVVPKLVAMATSLRPSILSRSCLSDSETSKTHHSHQTVISRRKPKSGCRGNLPYLQGISNVCILSADHSNLPSITNRLVVICHLWQSSRKSVRDVEKSVVGKKDKTRMWANAQPDGRPAEHRWRPLFNAAKFGRRPLLDAVQ